MDTNVYATGSKHYRLTKSLNITYSQRICFDVFRQVEIVIANCKCNHPKLPKVLSNTSEICKTISDLKCGEYFLTNTTLAPTDIDCPMECDTTEFRLETNSAYYPTQFYSKILMSQVSVSTRFKIPNQFKPGVEFNSTNCSNITSSSSTQGSGSNQFTSSQANSGAGNPGFSTGNSGSSTKKPNSSAGDPDLSQGDLSKACLKVSIFYHDLSYTFIEEQASVTIETLIGTIGLIIYTRFIL